jgi:acetyl-CoA C-acetyltransferase
MQEEKTQMQIRCPAVIGAGRTQFGEHYEREPEALIEEAGLKALDTAGIERRDLDACYLADYFLPFTNKIGLEEGFFSELLELHVPMEITRSFSSALFNASNAIKSGQYQLVLVGGMEKMSDRWDKIRDDLMLLEDPWSYYAGCTPEANHELMLREYLKKYKIHGADIDKFNTALAQISAKNHKQATKNEYAQYQREVSVEQVLKARERSRKPLGLLDFAPISDGAAALILASPEVAKAYTDMPVYVLGSGSATDYVTFPSREDRTSFVATELALENALRMANIQRSQIQILELYDQSTMLEMVSLEDMGFCKRGTAWINVYDSCLDFRGYYLIEGRRLYVNLNGGLKADGNPLGATGGAQAFEIVKQLSGEAGERQVLAEEGLQYGCSLELEGFGTKAYVHVFGRD